MSKPKYMDALDELLNQEEQAENNKPEEKPEVLENQNTEVVDTTTQTEPDSVLDWFKENGYDVKSRDELQPFIEKAKNFDSEIEKYKPFQTKAEELEVREKELSEKLNLLKDFADPLKLFNSEDEYKATLLRKQRPDLDPNALTQIMTNDTSKMSPLEVLKLQIKLNDSDVYSNTDQIEAYLADKYGIDFDTEFNELETLTQTKIKKDAKEALKEFNTLKAEVKIPEVVDVDSLLQQRQTQSKEQTELLTKNWKTLVNQIPEKLDKIAIAEDGKTIFEFNIGDDFKKQVTDNIGNTLDFLVSKGLEPNAENVQATVNQLKEYYFNQPENRVKILKAYAAQEVTKRELELKKEYDNPTFGNRQQAHRESPKDIISEQEAKAVISAIRGY